MKNKILLSGASGFVGSSLLNLLITKKENVSIIVRKHIKIDSSIEQILVKQIDSQTDWSGIASCSVLIHCAASAHGKGVGSLDYLREVNANGTLHLAEEAFKAGMNRFVFVSSIGVNGSETNRPFTENCVPAPCSDYAISKYDAEEGLKKLSIQLGFELVIVRPPLVCGINAPGNFGQLVNLVSKVPVLPFYFANNARSFVTVDNLASFLYLCSTHPKAAGEMFLISDGEDISTRRLTNMIATGLGKKRFQLPFPIVVLRFIAKILGKERQASQIFGDLQIDSIKAKRLLGWIPFESISEALSKSRKYPRP